jgi:Uma2 family endonuclease
MSPFIASPPSVEAPPGDCDRIVLRNVPWKAYAEFRDDDANQQVRMSYYKGTLELMSPRYRHEKHNRRLGHLIWELVVALDLPCACAGSTTFRREEEGGAGKEPDTCFYIANEPLIRDKDEIDLSIDPPPDLAIEVDDLSDSKGKLPIYAALRVPEVWRYDAKASVLWFGRLGDDRTYIAVERSVCLPMLTPARVLEALSLCRGIPESRWGRLLREWIGTLAN